jgi:hypothetical protein
MGFTEVVIVIGLVFGMISIKLMSVVESAQVIIVRQTRLSGAAFAKSKAVRRRVVLTFSIGNRKLLFLRFGAWFFARISYLIFTVEAMYPEKFVEGATLKMMRTVMISNQIREATIRRGKHAVRKMRLSSRRQKQ